MEIDQNIFFDEFNNKIIELENALIDLQNGNREDEIINEMFRAIHTIKSTSDLLGMFTLVAVTHKAEDVLDDIRNKKLIMDDRLCSLFIEFKDYIAISVKNISMGIFDDEVTENLTIYFEKEFNDYLNKALSQSAQVDTTKTILVVEDSTFVRYMIKKIAIEHNYSVLITDNIVDAQKKLESHDVDLVLCDVSSRNINAKRFLNSLRLSLEYDFIPVVMLLDNITLDLKAYGKQIQAKAWLTKPIDEDKLVFVLDKILE